MTFKFVGKEAETPWVVVTGLDGSGKTTLCENLENYFKEKKLRVKRFRSPHDEYLTKTLLNVSGSGNPDKDVYTDRTIFMLDNRILGSRINEWRESGEYDILLSQRGFFDSFVHGKVKDLSYGYTAEFNRIWELPKCQVMIHLVANATTAYSRIENDPDKDKFETPEYIKIQEKETRNAYEHLSHQDDIALKHFFDCVNIYIDTTNMTTEETFEHVVHRLEDIMEF